MNTKILNIGKPITLESGVVLEKVQVAYHTFGKLNANASNVIWVCHALTANSNVLDWWSGLFGADHLFDPEKYFIVCANNLGSHYGTTGPLSINPSTGKPYYQYFPEVTIRDIVSVHQKLKEHLGIARAKVLIGSSQGGQQALEWSIKEPDFAENLILIASSAQASPWSIAFNESQRLSIFADRTYYSESPDAAQKGLKAARSIALLSYRSYETYTRFQKDESNSLTKDFRAASYQQYQGEKLVARFNAYSYVKLLNAMDSHNVGRDRQSPEKALQKVKAKTLVVGIKSDILFPPVEQKFLYSHIPNAFYAEIDSEFGHDGFLIETKKLESNIKNFISIVQDFISYNEYSLN